MKFSNESGVYLIENKNNGKVYVGSAVNLARRTSHHVSALRGGYHRNRYLQRAWIKHGEEVFSFSILEVVDVHSELIPCEQKWLDLYTNLGEVYNLCKVAGSSLGVKMSEETKEKRRGIPRTAETKAKLSAANIGKKLTTETKAKMSDSRRGKSLSAEHRASISESNSGKVFSPEHRARLAKAATGKARSAEAHTKMLATKARLREERDIMAAAVFIFILGLEIDDEVANGVNQ